MKELTISQIKAKQIELETKIKDLIDSFYEETTLEVKGKILCNFKIVGLERETKIYFNYSNPFD